MVGTKPGFTTTTVYGYLRYIFLPTTRSQPHPYHCSITYSCKTYYLTDFTTYLQAHLGPCSYDDLYGLVCLSCADDYVIISHVITTIFTTKIFLYYINSWSVSWEKKYFVKRTYVICMVGYCLACAYILVIILHSLYTIILKLM